MKKTALTLLKAVVSIGILVYIFTKVVNIGSFWTNLKQANPFFFAAAVVGYLLVQTLSAYRWHLLLRPQNIEISFAKTLGFYFLGMYFNFFLPSSIGGDVFRIYYLNKETSRLSASTASVFIDRDVGMGGLMVLATAVAAIAGTRVNGFPLAPIFALISVAFIAANLALFYRPTYNLIHRLLKLCRMKRADEKVERLFESVNSYRGKWKLLTITMIISIGVQLGCALVNVLSASSIQLNTRHGLIDYLIFIPTIGLIGMVPISINGTGWREMSYILLFQSVATDANSDTAAAKAATLAFLWLGVVVITALPGGVIYLLQGSGGKRAATQGGAGASGKNVGPGLEKKESILPRQSSENEPVSTL